MLTKFNMLIRDFIRRPVLITAIDTAYTMKTKLLLLLFLLCFPACEIATVDYAVNDVQLLNKAPVVIENHPAVRMTVSNQSDAAVYNIKVTIKAKKNQEDISVVLIKLPELGAAEGVEKTAVFSNLSSHLDYEFLTYAVDFSHNTTIPQSENAFLSDK